MAGSGQTVVKAGAVAILSGGGNKFLATRTLTNEGTMTFSEGQFWMSSGAHLGNVGTLIANSEYGIPLGSGEASIVNSGTFEKASGAGTTEIGPSFENSGTMNASVGELRLNKSLALSSGKIEGKLSFGGSITATSVKGEAASVTVLSGATFLVSSGHTIKIGTFTLNGGFVGGAGTLEIINMFTWGSGEIGGTGTTVLAESATGEWTDTGSYFLTGDHNFVNFGSITASVGQLWMYENAAIENYGIIKENGSERLAITFPETYPYKTLPYIYNYGLFEKAAGSGRTEIGAGFTNLGEVTEHTGTELYFSKAVVVPNETEWGEEANPSAPSREPAICGEDVDCATGNLSKSETDFSIGGRGVGLGLTRTYNSQAAADGIKGPFGFGWSSSFSDHLAIEKAEKRATLTQADGSMVAFTEGTGGTYTPPVWSQDELTGNESSGYTVTLPDQTAYKFSGTTGRLESVTDRSGNSTTIAYNGSGKPETITDPAGRTLKLAYNAEGLVTSVEDPMGHVVKYAYESGNLVSVIQPSESALRWQFKYDGSHQLTELVDGRGGKAAVEYDGSHQVIKETDPLSRVTKYEYKPFQTLTKNEVTGAVTSDSITSSGVASAVTKGYGTPQATTESMTYDGSQNMLTSTDGNEHTTKYSYDSHGNRTSKVDPEGNKTEWTYDGTHDVLTETKPGGEKTTITRDEHGNPTVISRPAPGSTTQETHYEYSSHGQPTSMTDPLGRKWAYEYDSAGDRTSETDPEGDKQTWGYDEDSQQVSAVAPRGNVSGAAPVAFTTTTERDSWGRPVKIVEPPREPSYNSSFGSSGSGNGQFEFPSLEALTPSGNLWVVDSNLDRLQEFNTKGEYVAQFGSAGTGDGQFKFPFGIAINKTTGDIYVSDRENYRIQEFSSTGTFIRTFGYGVTDGAEKYEICTSSCRAGITGSGVGQFHYPDGIAIDSGGNLWVVDEVNDRLEKISENGEYINEYGSKGTGNGQLSEPVAIAYDKGNLYVTEATNDRVQEFSSEGAYVAKFGSEGNGEGQFEVPYAIAAGPTTDELYVTDRENNRVEIFTASGGFMSSFGTKGKSNGYMESPTGVVATASETLCVSDHTNERIENWTGFTARVTKYAYDADGNLESKTDPDGNVTKYVYDADNENTKVEEPGGTITETGYDGAGQVTSQTDGRKHTTKYVRNALEEVTEVLDPLSRKTTKEYDAAGNLTSVTDAAKRTTSYKYDRDNRPTEVSYSDGKTPTVKYEYDKDGNRTKMTDGTGTTKYVYDQLDRLTETENGHKETVKYEYSLNNQPTKITYPNGKSVTRAYDKDGRLEKTTDWLEHTTKFSYNPDSDVTATVYPSGTGGEDTYAYNLSDQMSEIKMTRGAETLASLAYARDPDGQIDNTISKGLLGSEVTEDAYDSNNHLTKAGATAYEYDAANNPTKIGASTYKYDNADELENGAGAAYTYDEVGERTKTTPGTGPATTYGYDQAGNLTSVERPKEGATSEIKDTYAYNGEGLRASQTIAGTTGYFAWDTAENPPLILSDGTNSYIYGPENIPIEQINTSEKALYLHHDQAGSTQFMSSETGTTEAAYAYTPYGAVEEHTGTATTPFEYDGQYTDNDTGLIYLRARYYDPTTAQFMTVDPEVEKTNSSYGYAEDDPLTIGDPTGLIPWSPKVKAAIAKCRSWKAWHSKKSPFYGNESIYRACQYLFTVPKEVYGTGPGEGPGGSTLSKGELTGYACGLSGPTAAVALRKAPGIAQAAVTFCVGYAGGELLFLPVLHRLAPSVFHEASEDEGL